MTETDELLLLRALLRASDYGVLLSDADRRDRVCNRRFCETFGLDGLDAVRTQPDYVRTHVLPRLRDPDGFLRTLEDVYADPRRVLEDEVEMAAPRPRLLRRYTAPVVADDCGRFWTSRGRGPWKKRSGRRPRSLRSSPGSSRPPSKP